MYLEKSKSLYASLVFILVNVHKVLFMCYKIYYEQIALLFHLHSQKGEIRQSICSMFIVVGTSPDFLLAGGCSVHLHVL